MHKRSLVGRLDRFISQASASTSTSRPQIAPLPHRSVLEISGPDAPKFLKGLSCKDVESTHGGYSGFLNASLLQGRILHTVFIFPLPELRYLITHESPSTHPSPLQTFLPPFRLRAKVRIRDVSDQWECWSAWGAEQSSGARPDRTWRLGSGGAAESLWTWPGEIPEAAIGEGEVACWDLRAGFGSGSMGRQLLVPRGRRPALTSSHDESSTDDYHLFRMHLGVPEGPNEISPGSALPLESCLDIHGGVDFRKGCYLGQELTVRTYHTGATRKRILPIQLFPLEEPCDASELLSSAMGAEIIFHPSESSESKKPRSAGRILSLHPTESTVGLGLVRLEMADRTNWPESIAEWKEPERGRLMTRVAGRNWGIQVGMGEAYRQLYEKQRSVE